MTSSSLYFHIPFCTKKCPYCHFYVIPNRLQFRKILEESLLLEWERRRPLWEGKTITSIYFGGGTPTLFGPDAIAAVLGRIENRASDCEITIEANPEETDLKLYSELRAMGMNRLSLGVQSLDDRSLHTLERAHTAKRAKEAIFEAHRAGFENISIDLMYDLPGQTLESWRYTLDQLNGLPIKHLSLYNLTIEPHTSFHKRKVQVPTGEISLQFLQMALERLQKLGLERYEISAFGRPSRHNLGYWTARPFLGFGPSAFSYWEEERFRNIANLQRYARLLKQNESPVDFREKLASDARGRELLAVRLRLTEGVPHGDCSIVPPPLFQRLLDAALLEETGSRIRLTHKGMLLYDEIASEII